MAVYIISDLHLSLEVKKPMDVFGPEWKNHDEKLLKNWNDIVSEDDTVLVPGDISWALKKKDAKKDLDFINKTLKGKKIFVRGNHDYWWHSVTKLNEEYSNIYFLQHTAVIAENFIVTGVRGWLCPDDKNFKTTTDKRIYERELLRLEMSLKMGKELENKKNDAKLISITHFPPTGDQKKAIEFTKLFEKYKVKKVFYGHLHTNKGYNRSIQGEFNGIEYELISSDYLNFIPKKIT
ncbi:MAG: metallophosphoesterase [Clostridiales Family XIII bacterium]|jgi:predicted phosphohydrolase|nr:metallophosphoesterase [Clostridiales Family XIII bacterium]